MKENSKESRYAWKLSKSDEAEISQNPNLNFMIYRNFYKNLWSLTLPIYLQMISTVLIAMLNSLLLRWIDGGVWTAVVNKANFAYNWVIFLPSFASAGVFVIMGNMLGQGRETDLHKAIFTGWMFNLLITFIVIFGLLGMKNFTYRWVNLEEEYWKTADIIYYINLVILFLTSINVVSQRAEIAIGKMKTIFLVLVLSNIVNTIIVWTVALTTPYAAIGTAFGSFGSAIFLTIFLLVLNFKHFNIKAIFTQNKSCWNKSIIKLILIIGVPTAIEAMIFNFAGAFTTKYVTFASSEFGRDDALFNTLIAAQQITNFGLLLSSSLGQVSSIFVARLIGSNIRGWEIKVANRFWYLTLMIALPFSLITLILAYPLLMIYNIPVDVIFSVGIFMLLIIGFQDFGRTMNQVGLSCLRAAKYTVVPVICAAITLSIFNIGFVILANSLIFPNSLDYSNQDLINNRAITLMLTICLIQAIEEIVRGSIYWILWNKKVWIKSARSNLIN
ncbi:MATE family efflux transporter [Spiroplasma endosymbiont of Panorpa germanica]|uniref:MATE family efflux transporter n=1 Tax=Spiroplasma endosymbiont of Panorpa germanica TaxID=3066314 RepID=UPI0030D26537